MTRSGFDAWTIFFYLGAMIVVIAMGWRGWRLGIVRQILNIVAILAAYLTAFVGGKYLIPVLRWLNFPDRILMVIGGALLGCIVFLLISVFSSVVFKRTSQQSVGLIRFGYGASGALVGAAFGLFLVLVMAVAIRLLGSVAESELANASVALPARRLSSSLAHIKHSIESGATGAVMEKVDPVPEAIYTSLGKVGRIANSAESMERFAENPVIRPLQIHPKIVALRDDPEIAKAIREQDFFSLLRHPKLIAAANDPEVVKILSGVDLEKVLNDAVGPENTAIDSGGR